MRVVHVLESTATGTLSMVQTISNRLATEGHDVIVLYSVRKETPSNLADLFHPGVELRHVQMKGRPVPLVLAALRREIAQTRADVVHLHSSFAGFLGRVATAFFPARVKFFYSPHCISFMRADLSTAKKIAFAGLEWLASWKNCTYVGCSASECAAVRRYIGKRIVLIENAIDGSIFSANSINDTAQDMRPLRRVISVGGIRPQKNPLLFAAIACRLSRHGVEFIWIGDGDDDLKVALRDAGVTVMGWQARSNVLAQMREADLYLSTSAWEGMPVSIIEAMAVNTPVLATGCAGNIDVLHHDQTGWLFDTEDQAVRLLERISADGNARRRIARNARLEALQRFSEDRFYNELCLLYSIPDPQLMMHAS